MVKKLRCKVIPSDFVRVSDWIVDSDIALQVKIGEETEDIFLSPSDAKKLRKQIKKALVKIEGGDEQETNREEPVYIPHVGEVVEVFQNTVYHDFSVGEKVRVVEVEDESVKAESLNGIAHWAVSSDIRPIQNWEPKEGEKVLIVDSTFVPSDTTREWVGDFGIIGWADGSLCKVYNEDKSDYFGYNLSDLRPAE